MSGKGTQSGDEALFAEASRWFARMEADDVSPDERERFSEWLEANADHRRAWAEVQALMVALKKPARASYEASFSDRSVAACRQGRASTGSVRWLGGAFALAVLVTGYFSVPTLLDRWRADVLTLAGQRQTVTLTDGTRVELDADTALKVDIYKGERRITVLRGEAFFDVAKDVRPFVVVVGKAELRDIGTAFVVNKTDDSATAAVESGVIDVGIAASTAKAVRVNAGQRVEIAAQTVSLPKPANLDEELAWRRGQVVFRQMRLSEVVARLNRYRQGRIVIVNPWISNQLVSGSFNTNNPDLAAEALEGVLGISALQITPFLTVLR